MPSLIRESSTDPAKRPQGVSQWANVWRHFKRDKRAVVGLWLVIALFLVAIAAPLIASERPLILVQDGEWSSPWLAAFFAPGETGEMALNKVFNWALLMLGVSLALAWPLRLLYRAAGKWPVVVIAVLVAAAVAAPFVGTTRRIDSTRYRELAVELKETGRGWAVFPLIPYGPIEQPVEARPYQPPSWAASLRAQADGDKPRGEGEPERRGLGTNLMGTDNVGRDVFVRVLYGARVSLSVGFVAVAIYIAIGTMIGAIAAYYGGTVDFVISRIIEIVMCFPTFLLILTIVAFLEKRSIFNIMIVIGLTGWTGVARLVRGEVLREMRKEYVPAARALGVGDLRLILRHLLPNSIAPVLVAATFGVAGAILTETGLSFLGLGVQVPTPSWGELLNQARAGVADYWWLTLFPGLLIFITVTIYNMVGEGVRDALDPRLRS